MGVLWSVIERLGIVTNNEIPIASIRSFLRALKDVIERLDGVKCGEINIVLDANNNSVTLKEMSKDIL